MILVGGKITPTALKGLITKDIKIVRMLMIDAFSLFWQNGNQ